MKYLILCLAIAYAQNSFAMEFLQEAFPDGITAGAVAKSSPDVESDQLSTKTDETALSQESCESPKALPAKPDVSPEERSRLRKIKRAKKKLLRRKTAAMRRYELSGDSEVIPPAARIWADVSRAEKEALGLYTEKPMPLSRTEAFKSSFARPPLPDADYEFPIDEDGPVAECVKAYSDYYTAHPRDESGLFVEWPPEPELDGKAPGWYWGTTNTGRLFLYFGGEDVFKAAERAIRDSPRAEDAAAIHVW